MLFVVTCWLLFLEWLPEPQEDSIVNKAVLFPSRSSCPHLDMEQAVVIIWVWFLCVHEVVICNKVLLYFCCQKIKIFERSHFILGFLLRFILA